MGPRTPTVSQVSSRPRPEVRFEQAGQTGSQAGANQSSSRRNWRRRRRKSREDQMLTAKSLTRKRVSKLSVPSRIRSKSLSRSSALCGIEIGDDAFDKDAGIHGAKMPLGGDGFRQSIAGVVSSNSSLALQIRRLDEIAVDVPAVGLPRTNQQSSSRGTDGAATNNHRARGE